MSVRVIVPPKPILSPSDIPGSHEYDDLKVKAWINAATAELDGPEGYLGRCIAPQTLEMVIDEFPRCYPYMIKLRCPPILSVDSIKYLDEDGVEQTYSSSLYEATKDQWFILPKTTWPATKCQAASVRVVYQAGYNDVSIATGGTGLIDARIKQAIKLYVGHYMSVDKGDLFLRAEKVEGIGERQYTVSDAAGNAVRQAANSLLAGLRVFE